MFVFVYGIEVMFIFIFGYFETIFQHILAWRNFHHSTSRLTEIEEIENRTKTVKSLIVWDILEKYDSCLKFLIDEWRYLESKIFKIVVGIPDREYSNIKHLRKSWELLDCECNFRQRIMNWGYRLVLHWLHRFHRVSPLDTLPSLVSKLRKGDSPINQ